MVSAIGSFVVTVGKEKLPVTHYLAGWSTRGLATRDARKRRKFEMRRPVSVVEVTTENCRRLMATGAYCR